MKNLSLCVGVAILSVNLTPLHSQPVIVPAPQVRVVSAPTAAGPAAIALTLRGKCEVSTDGVQFTQIKKDQVLTEGATIRTGENGRIDLYFKRTGVAIRLQKESVLKLTKMEQAASVSATQLELERGCVYTLVRGSISGPFEINNSNGLAVAAGKSSERSIITASSTTPLNLKSINLTAAAPAQSADVKFNKLEAARFNQTTQEAVNSLLEFDEIQLLTETWTKADTSSSN